jgi:hypothetical protein
VTATDPVGWAACLDDLREVANRLRERVEDGREADMAVKMFGAVTGAYLTHLWAEPDHTAFLPSVGYYQMYGTPNPDTLYRNAAIDGTGEYVIRGHRGTVPDVSIMPFGSPTATGLRTFRPFDFNELTVGADGTFEVLLSAHPSDGATNWWHLEPDMRTLMLRSVSDDWGVHVEPRVAIVRLDVDPRRPSVDPDALRRRLQAFATVVEAMVMSGINRVAALRSGGIVNQLSLVDYSANGGLADQWYQEGCFALGNDEVLLVEARPSPEVRAYSLALTDPYFSTIDWANAQSSLNRNQAVIDPDGVLRAVVAASDPGVRNWLDTTGHRFGVLQCRWSGGPLPPHVVVTVVPEAALFEILPAPVERVTPEERSAAVRARQIGVQLRGRW